MGRVKRNYGNFLTFAALPLKCAIKLLEKKTPTLKCKKTWSKIASNSIKFIFSTSFLLKKKCGMGLPPFYGNFFEPFPYDFIFCQVKITKYKNNIKLNYLNCLGLWILLYKYKLQCIYYLSSHLYNNKLTKIITLFERTLEQAYIVLPILLFQLVATEMVHVQVQVKIS